MINKKLAIAGTAVVVALGGFLYVASAGVHAADIRKDPPCSSYLVDGRDGTVRDECTKLIWQKDQASSTYSWDDANSYCAGLVLGGRRDWRVPTENELNTIIDYSTGNPAVNPLLTFSGFDPNVFVFSWSETPSVYIAGRVWAVRWNDASISSFTTDNQFGVRCVRTDQDRFE